MSGTRCGAFCDTLRSGFRNTFRYIEVEHKDINLVGELNINTTDREAISLFYNRTSGNISRWSDNNKMTVPTLDGEGLSNIPYNGVILYDYDTFTQPLSTYYNGYNWHIKLSDTSAVTSAKFRLIDNYGNCVKPYKNLTLSASSMSAYHKLSAQKGDVNYDGFVTIDDANIIMDYVLMVSSLSNLQYYLADYNNDGTVNVVDVVALQTTLPAAVNISEQNEIDALNKRIEEYYTNQIGVDFNEKK